MSHNFVLSNCDTDSICFCKPDGSPFSKDEQTSLLNELNSLFPEKIHFDHDGIFTKMIVLKAKNYIMKDENGKVKVKGSALKDTKKPKALKELIEKIIDSLLNDRNDLELLYIQYVKEVLSLKDITRYAKKVTLTEKTFKSERANETKIVDAIEGTEFSEGDKKYVFFRKDGSLCLVEKFDGNYDEMKLIDNIYKTFKIFESVIDFSKFVKYTLKRNKEALEELRNV